MDSHDRPPILRRAILRALRSWYPGSASRTVLAAELETAGLDALMDGDLDGHLAYLSEKGFIALEHRRAGSLEIRQAVITARGIDYVDGRIERDPGVAL